MTTTIRVIGWLSLVMVPVCLVAIDGGCFGAMFFGFVAMMCLGVGYVKPTDWEQKRLDRPRMPRRKFPF